MKILVTGGMGFIGSHTIVELINEGHSVICVDNLSNSAEDVVGRIKSITNIPPIDKFTFIKDDLRLISNIFSIFEKYQIDAVIHFAAFKSVGESVSNPIGYYHNNITGLINLVGAMNHYGCKNLIFSSSATVYGDSEVYPFTESMKPGIPTNPYGATKSMGERILSDLVKSNTGWNITALRYFNPIGAHPSGLIGERPIGEIRNLIPYVAEVAAGKREILNVFGGDYPTKDGTCIRDYTHVVDVARAHVSALKSFEIKASDLKIYNVGTGIGYSVLDVVDAYGAACGKYIPYVIVDRRPGDVAVSYCDNSKIKNELGWEPKYTLTDMCVDSWNWTKKFYGI